MESNSKASFTKPLAKEGEQRIYGLAPIVPACPRLLLLGSMPSVTSLAMQQYYANPQNAFWWIFQHLINSDEDIADDNARCALSNIADYDARCALLKKTSVALWDVLASCHRRGSLDSAIENEKTNDIVALLKSHKTIVAVAFNGGKAWSSFRRYILPLDKARFDGLKIFMLPSSSPANASITRAGKLAQWQVISEFLR